MCPRRCCPGSSSLGVDAAHKQVALTAVAAPFLGGFAPFFRSSPRNELRQGDRTSDQGRDGRDRPSASGWSDLVADVARDSPWAAERNFLPMISVKSTSTGLTMINRPGAARFTSAETEIWRGCGAWGGAAIVVAILASDRSALSSGCNSSLAIRRGARENSPTFPRESFKRDHGGDDAGWPGGPGHARGFEAELDLVLRV